MEYEFSSEVWLYDGQGAWHFITLPQDISTEIRTNFGQDRPGWGSILVTASIGNVSWKTSIFPDKKAGAYLLPLKVDIRKRANLHIGDVPTLTLKLNI